MTPEAMRTLYGYCYWAFERVWGCIMQLSDDQFREDIDYSTGSIRNQVVHLMSSTRRWMARMQGAAVPPQLAFQDYPTRAATKAAWEARKAEALGYVHGLDQAQLDEAVSYAIQGRGIQAEARRWELLLHVANHATDHRAQILALLHLHFGVETVEQDMLFYLLEAG